MAQNIYVSVNLVTTGPIPGPFSITKIGAAAYKANVRKPISVFEIDLPLLADDESVPIPEDDGEFLPAPLEEACAKGTQAFVEWLRGLPGRPTLVGYAPSVDFMWLYWYCTRFAELPVPFGYQTLDLKTMASIILDTPFADVSKKTLPIEWYQGCPDKPERPLDKAISQGVLFLNILADR